MAHQEIKQGAEPSALDTGRPPTMGTRGAVAAPHYLASQAGLEMLKKGGHAADAAIAMNATLAVVYNHMAGLGGDMFCQVWDSKPQKVEALNGSGRSGQNATIDLYKGKGMDVIPQRGPLAANTVPGVVDAWAKLHERYGRLNWDELFQPAIQYAEDGFPISQKFSDYTINYASTLQQFPETARVFLPGRFAPEPGQVFRQPDLAKSLKLIAEKGPEVFYKGELAESIIRSLQDAGGLLTREDFAEHSSDWVEPVRTDYKGLIVTELPPNTQGIATLMILNLIEPYNLNEIGDNTADYYHLMTEAIKIAFADRDRWVTDPAFLDIPLDRLTSKDYAQERRSIINMVHAKLEQEVEPGEPRLAADGNTTYMCAVDDNGNACSLIQSVYHEFGSAFMPAGTGILLQNRGSFFKLDPNHPNKLEPKKRTFHTIIPAMALKNNRPFMLFGTMGGEGQPQTQTAMLTRVVDFGYNIQQAIEAPRWLYGRTWGEESKSLKLEGRIPDAVAADLKRRSHDVQMMEDWSQNMGHAQGITIDQEAGVFHAGADPRGDGLALSW
ncbi:MAG: gamma-glutamyltransferase [Actinobacteria bacterium]|nr:gamma-glutamyltransferase [Actinomycetota bacterium]